MTGFEWFKGVVRFVLAWALLIVTMGVIATAFPSLSYWWLLIIAVSMFVTFGLINGAVLEVRQGRKNKDDKPKPKSDWYAEHVGQNCQKCGKLVATAKSGLMGSEQKGYHGIGQRVKCPACKTKADHHRW